MKKLYLAPVAATMLLTIASCSSGPSAACLAIDAEVRELQDRAEEFPSLMEDVKEYRLTRVNELYDFCLSNPPQFLKNREYWTEFGGQKVPNDTCSSWRLWAGMEVGEEIESELGKLQEEMNGLQFKAASLIKDNQECFDVNGVLK